jgi:hypothetical protein
MTTITIKINERTKAGKAFMAMTNFFRDSKAIEIIEPTMTTKEKAFLKDIENGLKEVKLIQEGKLKPKTLEELLNEN